MQDEGLFASVKRMLATGLEIAQVRLDLLGTELEFAKRRLTGALLWGAVGLMALGIGLVLACGFIVLLFWDGYRVGAIGVLALVFIGSSALLLRAAAQRLQHPKVMFEASLNELKADVERLKAAQAARAAGAAQAAQGKRASADTRPPP